QVGRLDMPPDWGGHTSFPVLGIRVPEFAPNARGGQRDIVVLVSESLRNECQEARQLTFLVDVTTESRPFPVATYQVPVASGDFCRRGGRFGPHSSNESFTPVYYGKLVFIAYFNAGVRAVDIRDPFNPREVGFYIPATTAHTATRCVKVGGAGRGSGRHRAAARVSTPARRTTRRSSPSCRAVRRPWSRWASCWARPCSWTCPRSDGTRGCGSTI